MRNTVSPSLDEVQVVPSPVEPPGSTPKGPSHLRLDVQGLRAVAVLLVLAFHAGLPVPGGFIGVDVFLVISGFVITGMLLREVERTGTIRLRTFYTRRVKRLLPALALLTTVVMVLSVFFGSSFGSQQTTATTGLGATYLAANVVIYRDSVEYFSPEAETNPLLHTWTLSVEEQTYLVFPSLLLGSWVLFRLLRRRNRSVEPDGDPSFVGRRSLRASRLGVGTMLAVIGIASFLVSLLVSFHLTSTPPAWAFYSAFARVWEFAVGAGLALAAARLGRIRPVTSLLLGVVGAAAILVGAFTLTGELPYPGTAALVPVLGAAAVIAAGFRPNTIVPRALATRPMVGVGDVSYSLYLWHWPLIVFAAVIWPGKPWVLMVAALASVLPAMASYRWLERPMRANPRIQGRRVVMVLAVCVLVPTAAALALLAGAKSSWGNEAVEQMQEQVGGEHAAVTLGCDEGQPGGSVGGAMCQLNADSTNPDVYLFGNSVAAMYSEAVIGATETLDLPLTLQTHSGGFCARIDAVGCQDMFIEAYDQLLNGGGKGVVVMSGTWDLGAFGGMSPEEMAAELRTDLTGAITALHEAGHHVLLVLPTPRFFYGEEPGTFVAAPLYVGTDTRDPHSTVWRPQDCPTAVAQEDPTACGATVSESDVEVSQALAIATLRQIAEDTGASTLNLRPRYCDDGVCSTNDGNFWMFEDGIHISSGESEVLAPTFVRVLEDILERLSEQEAFEGVDYTFKDGDIAA